MAVVAGWGRRAARWVLPGLAGAALLVMTEVSQLLASLESAAERKYSMGALTGWPGLRFWQDNQVAEAINLWSDVATRAGLHNAVLSWIRLHLAVDFFIFAPIYATGLCLLLQKLHPGTGGGRPPRWPKQMAWTVLTIDWVETGFTYFVVGQLTGRQDGWMTLVLAGLTAAKWLTLGTVLMVAALRALYGRALTAAHHRLSATGQLPTPDATPSDGARVWSRHRTQLGVVVVLAAAVALPAGGPLAQLPDILRTWTNGPDVPAGNVAGPALTLLVLCVALWIAGRWALLDGAPRAQDRAGPLRDRGLPRAPLWPAVGGALGLAAGLLLVALGWATLAILAAPAVMAAVLVIGALQRLNPFGTKGVPDGAQVREEEKRVEAPIGVDRNRVCSAGRVLAVVPLTIAGLGLVRAFAAPLLLAVTVPAFPIREFEVAGWLAFGLALTLAAAPVAAMILGWADGRLLGDRVPPQPATPGSAQPEPAQPEPAQRGPAAPGTAAARIPNRLGLVVFIGALLLGVATAIWPPVWGPLLGVLGVVALLLATVTLAGAWLTRRGELRRPMFAFTRPFRRTPVWLLALATFLLAGWLDTTGGHHDVRLDDPTAKAPEVALRTSFASWLTRAAPCQYAPLPRFASPPQGDGATTAGSGDPAAAVPLVLLAAPGGGIRAAYWTALVTDRLAAGERCGGRALFAASGVSGGSLGLVTFVAARARVPAPDNGEPVHDNAKAAVTALAREDPLAASVAAALYRDLPRAFHGINRAFGWPGHDDRAGLLERGWQQADARLGADFYQATPPPGSDDDHRWWPLLLLNGTEVNSGCRVLASPLRASGHPPKDQPPRHCRDPAVAQQPSTQPVSAREPRGVDAEQFAAGAIDAAGYLDRRGCEPTERARTLRLSTAALLSARFAFVSPTGEVRHCNRHGEDPTVAHVIDGGYLENNGIAALLELWNDLEPMVAEHNRALAAARPSPFGATAYVVPLFVVADNHYFSVAAPAPPSRPRELFAPIRGRSAPTTVVSSSVLEQAALLRFSGPLPGTTTRTVTQRGHPIGDVRSFRIAPCRRPGVEAPLGWVLSRFSTSNLDGQLHDLSGLSGSGAMGCGATTEAAARAQVQPRSLAQLQRLLSGPLKVQITAPHPSAANRQLRNAPAATARGAARQAPRLE